MDNTGTWRKTTDGLDVYVQDDGWVWSHQAQGWFYEPEDVLSVPKPPMDVRARDEVARLRTGWPSFWKIFDLRHERGLSLVLSVLMLGALVWMWGYMVFVNWGVQHWFRSWHETLALLWYERNTQSSLGYGAWYFDRSEKSPEHIIWTLIFLVFTAIILYSLYVGVANAADPHKGLLLLAPVALVTVAGIVKRNRAAELAHHLHDVRRE